MITANEVIYLFVGIIISFFFTTAIANISRHKFSFPHRYFEIVLIFWGASYLFYLPCFHDYYQIPWINFARDLYNALCCPVVLICFNMLTRVQEKGLFFRSVISYAPPFVAISAIRCFGQNHTIILALLAVIVVETFYWTKLNVNYIKSYNQNLLNYVTDTKRYSNKWIAVWVRIVAVVTYLWCIRAAFEPVGAEPNPVTVGMLTFDMFIYFPCFLIFSVLYNRFHYFDGFLREDKPTSVAPWKEEQKMTLSDGEEFSLSQDTVVNQAQSSIDTKISKGLYSLSRTDFFLRPDLTMRDTAHEVGVHRYQLVSYLHTNDITFYDLVETQRVRRAEEMLREQSDITPEEVALRCGFSSYRVMAKAFESRYECSPEQYRSENNTDQTTNF